MTNKTITDLTVASALDGSEFIPITQGGNSRRVGLSNFTLYGETPADKIVEDSGTITPVIYQSVTPANGAHYVFTVVAKAGERHRLNLYSNQTHIKFICTFDLLRGTAVSEFGVATATITDLGEGWYRCAAAVTASDVGGTNFQIKVYPDVGGQSYTGDGASGLYIKSVSITEDSVELLSDEEQTDMSTWSAIDVTISADAGTYRTIVIGGQKGSASNYFSGKKWAALGTSITAQNKYTVHLEYLLGATLQNLGVSGGCLASGGDSGSLDIYNEIANIDSDTDLVTLEAGINDFGKRNSDLGSLGDTTTSTFYGALYAAIVAIQSQAPSASIVMFTPYGSDSRFTNYTALPSNTDSNGDTLIDFQNAVREVGNMLSIPVIDVARSAGFGYLTNSTWTSDGLHHNAAGGERYAAFVRAALDYMVSAGAV